MAQSYLWNVRKVVVVTDSVNVFLFVYLIPGMICMMCCTGYIFVMALKVKKGSSAQNRGLAIKKGLNAPEQEQRFECSRARTKV